MVQYVLYTKTNCVFCDKAKALLSNKGLSYVAYILDQDFTREQLLEKYPNAKTFPVIEGPTGYIGGYTQLEALLNDQ